MPQNQLDQERRRRQEDRRNRSAASSVTSSPNIAKLSVSGVGLRTHTGVAIRMFKALAEAGINVDMINTSEVRVNVVVDGAAGREGAEAAAGGVCGCDAVMLFFFTDEECRFFRQSILAIASDQPLSFFFFFP